METLRSTATITFVIALALATPIDSFGAFTPFSVGGDDTTASIQTTVDAFRTALGDQNNGNVPGPLFSGHREINWDGGGATTRADAPTPFAGFQNSRGALFTTPGTGFSQVPADQVDDLFNQPSYNQAFGTFSPVRLFTAIDSNVTEVTFFVPGPNASLHPATVSGFGSVFTDVDLGGTTKIEFFGPSNQSLFSGFVLPGSTPNASLSFLGAIANAGERIALVRITTGNSAGGPVQNANTDVVLMDDFLYTEPQAVPEPAVLGLFGLGLTALALRVRRI
jgi:hypothetical protein